MFKKRRNKSEAESDRRVHIDDLPKPTTPDPGISERGGAIDYTPREKEST